MAVTVKALFFDVFGTLVDWRSSIARENRILIFSQVECSSGFPISGCR